jgi:hypothetical protein
MALYEDSILLLDRTQSTRTLSNEIPNGDLKPWRVRLEMTNTAETGADNSGSIKLRIDELGTFIKTGPLLMEEDAKTKYLIECKIVQGANVSKIFRFRLGTPTIDVDQNQGAMLQIKLQELQIATKEALSSAEYRFVTPYQVMNHRINDFNSFQNAGVNLWMGNGFVNNLPNDGNLKQHYVPSAPRSFKALFDDVFENLAREDVTGGTFTDYYYDYDVHNKDDLANSATNLLTPTFEEIGKIDSGVILNPLSAEAIDSEEHQSAGTDFYRYRNQVIARGAAGAGSLPPEHSIFASEWLHAKQRPEHDSSVAYIKGDVVKITYFLDEHQSNDPTSDPPREKTIDSQNVIRFFMAKQDVPAGSSFIPTASPMGTIYWLEDFSLYPFFDKTGHFTKGDVIVFNTNPSQNGKYIRYYQAEEDIYDWSINRYRQWADDTPNQGGDGNYPAPTAAGSNKGTKHLSDSTGFLLEPDENNSGFRALNSLSSPENSIPDQDNRVTNFVPFKTFSPWTQNAFDWEKNLCGLKSGSLPLGTSAGYGGTVNRYVGMCPDWNICKDVYDKQDATDEFESVTMKWVHSIDNYPPDHANFTGGAYSKLKYHGQRFLVGPSGADDFSGHDDQIAQWDKIANKWQFSRTPKENEIINNLDDAKVYQYRSSVWTPVWQIQRDGVGQKPDFVTHATPFHIVKDIYKVAGFEGTPNNAIEFRYVWDTNNNNGASMRNYHQNALDGRFGDFEDKNTESLECRRNSRGVWMWFWNPFPRLGHSDNGTVNLGSKFGGHGDTGGYSSGFTTLNAFNLTTDRFQSKIGWNNGLKSEDMGRISSISFKMKVGVYAQVVDTSNDARFWELDNRALVVGLAKIPMTFWAVDMFDRIWYKKFELRRNGYWDEVRIPFHDMNQANLYLPRFDELWEVFGRPLGFTNFALKQREYTGVAFDWRFVRGWGVQYDGGYDENGYYNGGYDAWWDTMIQWGEQAKAILYNAYARGANYNKRAGVVNDETNEEKLMPNAYAMQLQATIAMDDLHYGKELICNSDDETVQKPRTSIEHFGEVDDYITLKLQAKGRRARLSFYPQFWHMRSIGDVRMRIGQAFKVKGDRIPDMTDMTGVTVWQSNTAYDHKDKVSYGDYVYQAREDMTASIGNPEDNEDEWTNLNQLACSEVKHVIDHSGYHMEVVGRRKFILTGEN